MAAPPSYEPLAARPDSNGPGSWTRAQDLSLNASPLASVGFQLTLLYVTLLVGRVPEIFSTYLGTSFYQILILTVMLLALVLITGTLVKAGSNRIGTLWIGFHIWIFFTLPFSGYRRGSVESLQTILIVLPSMFFIGGFFIRDRDTLRKGIWAMAWAGIIGLLSIRSSGVQMDEDRLVATGTFANSNFLAIYLLMMIPIWAFITFNKRYSWFIRLCFAGAIVTALLDILKTGSRSGFITVGLLAAILFFGISLANKAKFIVVAVAAVAILSGTMSSNLKSRLGTVFGSAPQDEVAAEAVGSSEARMALLIESIDMTIKHPIVGAGLGVSSLVMASDKIAKGERTAWQVSHNMYTQISSELGFPGILLYLTGIGWSLQALWKVFRAARIHIEVKEPAAIAAALLCCWVVFLFNGIFTSMALDFWIYVLSGFSIATAIVCEDIVRQKAMNFTYGTNQEPIRSSRFFPTAAPKAPELVAEVPAKVEVLDAPWKRNPRKYPPKPGTSPR